MSEWIEKRMDEVADFNPRESLKKGSIAKKVAMDKLQPFCRDVPYFEMESFSGGTKFRNNDTIMARITPCLENGKTAKVNILEDDEIGFGSTEFIVFRAKEETDPDFLYYLVISPAVREPAIKSIVGSSGRQRVQTDVVQKLMVRVPDLNTQRAIAGVLKSLDDKIAENRKINDNLEATAQAVFQEQFASFYGADELPDGYSIVNLDSLCTVKGGKRLPADCELLDTPTEHPYIRVRDVGSSRYVCLTNQFQYIDEETHSAISRYIVNTGDIVISIVGTIGLLGKVHSSLDKANLTENCVKLTNIHTVTSDYLYYTLCYKKQIKEIELLTVGAVQAKLPIYNIQSMKILVPPTKVIEDFQNKMDVFNEQIEANTVEVQKLYELQEVLLAKLSD